MRFILILFALCFIYVAPFACDNTDHRCGETLQELEKRESKMKAIAKKAAQSKKKIAEVAPAQMQGQEVGMPIIEECVITPAIWELKTPPEIAQTNNLRRKTGSTEFAIGAPIMIIGNVLDSDCSPVTDAVVEIWQANAKGGLDYEASENKDKVLLDRNFVGSGSMQTDNAGSFYFITVMPGATSDNDAPRVHLKVKHRDFDLFETAIYFENQALNAKDSLLSKNVTVEDRNLLVANAEKSIKNISEAGIIYRFNVTLDGKNKFKKY